MGRIDEALRRVEAEKTGTIPAADPPPEAPATDVFVSPWSFQGEAEPRLRSDAATPEREETLTDLSEHTGRLSVFRGFNPELYGRIVAAPGASPLLAEQFRRLAATLHHAQLVQGTKTIMITSADPGDGKTLTATNLALTLSESYRRQVLLIDADLRRPTLHEVFRVPNVSGLNEGLKSEREGRLAVLKVTETLTLLPAGRPDPDPMSSLTSARMADIVREGASRFDWVIVDSAPVGLLADAKLLSTMIDNVLLVVRANRTPFASVTRAIESLGRDRVLGVILNAIEAAELDSYRDYSGYYHAETPPRVEDNSRAMAVER